MKQPYMFYISVILVSLHHVNKQTCLITEHFVLMRQGSVHHFEEPSPATLDAVLTWLDSIFSESMMHTSKLCLYICFILRFYLVEILRFGYRQLMPEMMPDLSFEIACIVWYIKI